jgi:flagellar biosynthesis GTPase FlhF
MPKSLLSVESEVLPTGPVVKLGSITITPAKLFEAGASELQTALDEIAATARAIPQDISTAAGRAAVISLAHKITRTKTTLGAIRKDYVSVLKDEPKRVDGIGKKAWDFLETLAAEIRQPVTDFELVEAGRLVGIKAIADAPALFTPLHTAEMILLALKEVQGVDVAKYGDLTEAAEAAREKTAGELQALLESAQKREAESAELAELRKRQADQERIDRERKIAEDATATAKKQAEEESAARVAKAEKEKAEAQLAQERAERQAKEEKEAAEQRAVSEKQAAQRREDQAASDERERIRCEKEASEAEAAAKQADQLNRGRVFGEIKDALSRIVSPAQAGAIVDLIEAGMIPHVEIKW